jgi:hypothetical protein
MIETTTGTVINGMIQLDKPLSLPDQTPVAVTVESIGGVHADSVQAWQSIQKRLQERPINSGGLKFTRDELHERR